MANNPDNKRRLIIVSGLSGSGKSVVLKTLEDLDFFCIDNLPLDLFDQLAALITDASKNFPPCISVGIDARSPENELTELPESIELLRQRRISVELIFIEANKSVLTTRFAETRRKHPLSSRDVPLSDAIDRERQILDLLSAQADLRIDTSHTSVHELRDITRNRLARRPAGSLSLQFMSFGYKTGVPQDTDFMFDVRCLGNPYWQKRLRGLSGKDAEVQDFLSGQPEVIEMYEDISGYLEKWLPSFEADNRSYLSVAIGCTGGQHRSVYFVERLSAQFLEAGKHVVKRHRDLVE